jgi:hypothetical protein
MEDTMSAIDELKGLRRNGNMFKSALIFFAGLGFWATEAQAAKRFGVVTVTNKVNVPINFQIKIGDGGWQNWRLSPGASRCWWHEYGWANEDRSPVTKIKFDSDLRNGQYWMSYNLQRRAAEGNACAEGKQHFFRREREDGNFVDLKG